MLNLQYQKTTDSFKVAITSFLIDVFNKPPVSTIKTF